jgi:CrcB protein
VDENSTFGLERSTNLPIDEGMNGVLVFLGGGLGSLTRYGLQKVVSVLGASTAVSSAWATLSANALASALLAVWMWKFGSQHPAHAAVAIGFCGGLSTFSTWSLELATWFREGQWPQALAYAAVSVLLGLLPFWVWSVSAAK